MDLDIVLGYHERTKHHFRRFARSAGHLDWATQPEPFRWFHGAERFALDRSPAGEPVDYDDLFLPARRPPAALDARSVSDLLFHALAVSAIKQAGGSRWALRVDPSSGNLHPTEGYLALPAVPGLADGPGVWHYLARDHALERRARLAPETFAALAAGLPPGSFLVGLTSIHWREAWKYGERAFRYCRHDAGHALAALRYAAAILGWDLRALPFGQEAMAVLLGADRREDFPEEAEREEPEVIAAVTPGPIGAGPPEPAPETLAALRSAEWSGEANVLSPDHVAWEVIGEVAAASRSPGGGAAGPAADPWPDLPPAPPGRPARDARALVRQRRSAVSYDGRTPVSADGFARILRRTLPGPRPPFDALPGDSRIHLALFVHRVEGLAPGLYALPRTPAGLPRLRAALREDFRWERVREDLPLFLLAAGDCRGLAAQLSCAQDIAGAGFASLGMIAEFEGALRAEGAHLYRRLFLEAGMVGQALYLEAEAEGARGTGIGCYFDDPVHEVLGLRTREFQSLYHFTFGMPVEDRRLTTLPAYA